MKNLESRAATVYYLTTALDNRAQHLASAHDLRVEVLYPKDLPLPADAVALIVDLDNRCLDAPDRRQWLTELTANPPPVATFVQSYDFADEEGATVENVVLARRLDDVLLRRLAAYPNFAKKAA